MRKKLLVSLITSASLIISIGTDIVFASDSGSGNKTTKSIKQNVEHYTTSNGMEVILKKVTSNNIIGVKLFLKGGSTNLNANNSGVEKLLISSMLQGSTEYPKDKLNMELAQIGTQIDSSFLYDYSSISMKSLKKYFNKSFNIFQSLINNPLLENNEIDLQKERMIAEIKHKIDDPDEYVWETLNQTFLIGHPYQNNVDGNLNTVPKLTKQDLINFKKENLVASKMLLVVVGNFNESIKKDIEKYFSKLPKGNYTHKPIEEIKSGKSSVTVVDRNIPTAYIAARFSIPSLKDEDYPATYLALSILSKKMYESVRTKHGLSYAVYSGASLREANAGYLYVTTIKPKESIELMYKEIENLQNTLVDKKYLQGVINLYYTRYYMQLEPNLEQAETLGRSQIISGDYNKGFTLLQKFNKVTPEDIKKSINKYVKNLHFGIIYKKDSIDEDLFTRM